MGRPRRTAPARASRRELLVFTEGQLTEEAYLKHWHRKFRGQVNVEINEFHGTPLALVKRAAAIKAANERAERKGRGRAHDEVWCVFDIDEYPHLDEAIELSHLHGIELAISNPCIELWFLLHVVDQTAYIDRHEAQSRARAHLGRGKDLDASALELLEAHFVTAKARAIRLDAKHEGDGTPAPGNPSSTVWRIIEAVARPQP